MVITVLTVVMTIAVTLLDERNQDVFLLCYGSGIVIIAIKCYQLHKRVMSKRHPMPCI